MPKFVIGFDLVIRRGVGILVDAPSKEAVEIFASESDFIELIPKKSGEEADMEGNWYGIFKYISTAGELEAVVKIDENGEIVE